MSSFFSRLPKTSNIIFYHCVQDIPDLPEDVRKKLEESRQADTIKLAQEEERQSYLREMLENAKKRREEECRKLEAEKISAEREKIQNEIRRQKAEMFLQEERKVFQQNLYLLFNCILT